jgi:hypothetical protein
MKKLIVCCFLLVLMTNLNAQEYISVPLDNSAYDIIDIGVMRGIITPPPSPKPWSVSVVRKKLWDMMDDPEEVLSSKELAMLDHAYESFEKKEEFTFLYTWESNFAVQAPDESISSVNLAKISARGDLAGFLSWDLTVLGEFLYIEREKDTRYVPSMFPYTMSKMWDGGVLSLRNAKGYYWPEDPSLAFGLQGELSGVLLNQQLQFRFGRLRRDWGSGTSGSSLFINAQSSPFLAIEGVYSPLSWLDISFLNGVTEYYQYENQWPDQDDSFFINMLTAVQLEFNPLRFIYINIGGSAVWFHHVNLAAFGNLELRVPGILKLWGGIFLDNLVSSPDDYLVNGNSLAYQAGIKTLVRWLPFGVFTLRYTKVEPYCYTDSYNGYGRSQLPSMSAFVSGGESLGYYIPPNSDELLIRLEAMFLSDLKVHLQFQMIRHGVDYGDKKIDGSSLNDKMTDDEALSTKRFLEDGVYRWDNVIKLGASYKFIAGIIPLSVYAELGFVSTSFTIPRNVGTFNSSVYRTGNGFVFSVGFKLFPR